MCGGKLLPAKVAGFEKVLWIKIAVGSEGVDRLDYSFSTCFSISSFRSAGVFGKDEPGAEELSVSTVSG